MSTKPGPVLNADTDLDALLVDKELADRVWELWNAGLIPDDLAAMAWWIVRHSADQLH